MCVLFRVLEIPFLKRTLPLFLLLLLALTVACGRKVEEKKVFEIMIWGSDEEARVVEQWMEEFSALRKGFEYRIISYPPNRYHEMLQLKFLKGNPPDLMYISDDWFAFYASNSLLAPLDPMIESDIEFDTADFFPQVVDVFRYNGKLYGMAKDFTPLVLYYNKDLFRKAGLEFPDAKWTWQQYLDAARKLTVDRDGDGVIDQFGTVTETWFGELVPWIWQNGASVMKEGKWVMGKGENRERSLEALNFIRDTIFKYKVSPSQSDLEKFGGGPSLFMRQHAAMGIYGRWVCLQFKNIDRFSWGIAPLPSKEKRATPLLTVSWAIAASSPRKQEAWDLLKYFMSTGIQRKVAESGLAVPVRRSVATSSRFLQSAGIPAEVDQGLYLDALRYARTIEPVPEWKVLSDALRDEFEPVFTEGKPVAPALDALQKQAEAILER